MGLWLPALDVNSPKAGINGIAGMQMVGINGHLGLLVAMMMMIGGRRDHNGTVNQRSISTKVRLQNGTVIILRIPGATIVEKHGMLLWRALTGDAKLLISHFRDEDLLHWDAGQRIFEVLAQAHKHISEFEDQDDFDNAFTNCTASATRHCYSLQMWPGLLI